MRPFVFAKSNFVTTNDIGVQSSTHLKATGGLGKGWGSSSSSNMPNAKNRRKGSRIKKKNIGQISNKLENFPKVSNLTDNTKLLKFLRSVVHKKIVLSGGDAKVLLKSLSKRLPDMKVHHVAETLWTIGTLRLRRSSSTLKVMDLALERLDQSGFP